MEYKSKYAAMVFSELKDTVSMRSKSLAAIIAKIASSGEVDHVGFSRVWIELAEFEFRAITAAINTAVSVDMAIASSNIDMDGEGKVVGSALN